MGESLRVLSAAKGEGREAEARCDSRHCRMKPGWRNEEREQPEGTQRPLPSSWFPSQSSSSSDSPGCGRDHLLRPFVHSLRPAHSPLHPAR